MNLDAVLKQVLKPARYIGNEINMVRKTATEIKYALCFPDTYEVGMSHLGLQILYYLINEREDTYCERVFAPWTDMEELMRKNEIPLFSLETGTSLCDFDMLGFTLQYEMSYTNIINMLSLGGIPLYSSERGKAYPLVCAGGPCAYNPEPLAEIVDFFCLGEGEALIDNILDLYKRCGTKAEFLESLLDVDGVYVPKFYDVEYKENGEIKSFKPNHPRAKKIIRKVIVEDMDKTFRLKTQLVPLIETVHDRVVLEVFRGCMRGCRFCQAGYVYRPLRERSPDVLLEQAENLIRNTGHEEISLLSLSTGDYTKFRELAGALREAYAKESINISLPSLRVDAFNLEMMTGAGEVRRSSLTFAPEAGTQRLRDIINKGITEQEIMDGCKLAFNGGWNRVKLYFMIGLPCEERNDILGIAQLSDKIIEAFYELPREKRPRPVNVSVSCSCFVPKPFTPFQWVRQDTKDEFYDKLNLIQKTIYKRQIKFNHHDPRLSIIEGVIARGDRRISRLIIKAWEYGAKFDGWTEHFSYAIWERAMQDTGISLDFYAHRQRSTDEILPWDHISVGVDKEFFIEEYERALKAEVTPNCRTECSGCGAGAFLTGGSCV